MDNLVSDFRNRVLKAVASIPVGKVASYGQIAGLVGSPRAGRQVGGVLRSLKDVTNIPWWRVVNSKGEISIKGNWFATKELQKTLLEAEGVRVADNYVVDMAKFRYNVFPRQV